VFAQVLRALDEPTILSLTFLQQKLGLKVYNDWPTFPQLIVKGEFVGGLDVVQEMIDNGEFKELVAA